MIDYEHVRGELSLRDTDELVDILVERDPDEWRPEVFPVVEEILRERGVSVADAVDARRAERSGGAEAAAPNAGPVVLERFDDEVEAQLCQMSLERAGIKAQLEAGDSGAVEILVAESQVAAAREVLDAAEQGGEGDGADGEFRCRSCGFSAEPLREGSRLVCQVCGAAD